MRLYRIDIRYTHGEHIGFSFQPNKREADKRVRELIATGIYTARHAPLEFPATKTGILALLREVAMHPDANRSEQAPCRDS